MIAPGAITDADIDEFAAPLTRPSAGAERPASTSLMLREVPGIRPLSKTPGLTVPVLRLGASERPSPSVSMSQQSLGKVRSVSSTEYATNVAREARRTGGGSSPTSLEASTRLASGVFHAVRFSG